MGRVRILRGMAVACGVMLCAGLAGAKAHAQDTTGFANEVLNLVNKERQANGLAPLSRAVELDRAAQKYAQYMGEAGFFSHNGPDGSTPSSRIAAEGYKGTTWGENIAAGQQTPAAVMNAWMNSSGHRANILRSSFKEIGIGVARVAGSPMGIYWVQNFGARNSIPSPGTQPPPAPKPSLSGVNPNRGKPGDTIALEGTNFGSTAGKVWFAGPVEGTVQSWTDTRISALIPSGAKTGAITVQNGNGTSNGVQLQVDPPAPETPQPSPTPTPTPTPTPDPGTEPEPEPQPTVRPRMTAVSPRSGKSGVLVVIKGTNFGTTPGNVYFGRTGTAEIKSWTNTRIEVVLSGTPGRRYLLPIAASGLVSRNMVVFAINP